MSVSIGRLVALSAWLLLAAGCSRAAPPEFGAPQAWVEVTAAGFKLVRTSDVLANPADAHTTQNAETAIRGHTDRFIMVFQKP